MLTFTGTLRALRSCPWETLDIQLLVTVTMVTAVQGSVYKLATARMVIVIVLLPYNNNAQL